MKNAPPTQRSVEVTFVEKLISALSNGEATEASAPRDLMSCAARQMSRSAMVSLLHQLMVVT